ncbi:hypothetical protein [Nocardia terpenica]|uniref:Enoyl reductase (ER) domain-containing protein n=1 Tax=Nocardia terpenica TaxID=455432 RepID=A0A164NKY0_9NOCA|nr:hypothetical protein AWN90_25770 [Nocardia terpenica]
MLPNPHGHGTAAEEAPGPTPRLRPQVRHLSHIEASAVTLAALTAWQALVDTANIQAGQRVLIHAAAGGVGHFAVQIAKHRGAHVIGTASSAAHRRERHPLAAPGDRRHFPARRGARAG